MSSAAAGADRRRRPGRRARDRRAGGPRQSIVLGRRRIYILPTRQGLGFAVLLVAMLLGSANYDNGLGYVLNKYGPPRMYWVELGMSWGAE